MTHVVRLDLELIRRNLEAATGSPQTHEDVMRLLAMRRVWRQDEEWFTADEAALAEFADAEVLDRRPDN